MKNSKTAVEVQDIATQTNLENFVLRERGLPTKMGGNMPIIRQTNVHYMVPMFEQLR